MYNTQSNPMDGWIDVTKKSPPPSPVTLVCGIRRVRVITLNMSYVQWAPESNKYTGGVTSCTGYTADSSELRSCS